MKTNQVSLTSLITAYARAYHSMHDNPKIFDDFLAYDFFTVDERSNLEQNLALLLNLIDPELAASCSDQASALKWVMRLQTAPATLSRARYTEDNLKIVIRQGVKQYVILGAGIDTFAFRHPDILEQLQVFEVDHPATQGFKLKRLAELGWELPAQLHFIPIDFTKENIAESLMRSSYNPQTLSFFSWLGVTMYLTRDEVFKTLRLIADIAPSGSVIIFDYHCTDELVPVNAAKNSQQTKEITQRIGEPMKSCFDPDTLATELENLGLRLYENLNPTDIEKRCFQERTDGYHANEQINFAYAVVI